MARPISASTARTATMETLPSAALGVPTEMNDTSVAATAAATSVVARSRPAATASAIRPSIASSTMGERPALTRATLSGATSTATTSWPREARQALETAPT
jgi:hypothetical protein